MPWRRPFSLLAVCLAGISVAGCFNDALTVERLFPEAAGPSTTWPACHLASPLLYDGPFGREVIALASDVVEGRSAQTGEQLWSVTLPAPEGEMGFVLGTPLLVDGLLFVGYHTTEVTSDNRDVKVERLRHLVAVVDVLAREVSPSFELLELDGRMDATGGGSVSFLPENALGRAKLVRGRAPGDRLGKLYVTFGNARDIQPWHGFAFEIDIDAWRSGGASDAISAFLVTTPESDCGRDGVSGSRDRVCGGGLWAPSGPLILDDGDSYNVILAPSNGQLNLERHDYANTLLKVGPGLTFDPGCDADLCADFNPDAPSDACAASCQNLFIPRLPGDDRFSDLVSEDRCEGLTMFECWATLDYIGGSTPTLIELPNHRVLLFPTKDGAVYLVDADHLGTLYQRLQLVNVCGTDASPCELDWAGMIVTQPAVTTVDGDTFAIVPTFMPDLAQHAGVFGLRVTEVDGEPRAEIAWSFPERDDLGSASRFRRHPSRPALQTLGDGRQVVWVVDAVQGGGGTGTLLGIDVATGALRAEQPLVGKGYRFVEPLVLEDRVIVPSCESNAGESWLEGYRTAAP